LAVIFGEDLFLRYGEIVFWQIFYARPKLFLFPAAMLALLHTTDLSNAFDSIWHSALFHQLIALDFPLSYVVYICSFLSDRRAEIISCVAGSRTFFDILQVFAMMSLLYLYLDRKVLKKLKKTRETKKVTLTNCQGAPIQPLGFLVWCSLYRLCINKLKRRSSGHALLLSSSSFRARSCP